VAREKAGRKAEAKAKARPGPQAARAAAPQGPARAIEGALREHYSAKAVDHMLRPRNAGRIARPAGYGRVESGHNESVEIFIDLEGGTVTACTFETDGCAATLACASAATELARGRTADEVLNAVTSAAIVEALGGLPPGNVHCAGLVAQALRTALLDARTPGPEPWKKLYRRF
jgi:nitrogen fixation NifU-like protein